jgi:hypothetical protein
MSSMPRSGTPPPRQPAVLIAHDLFTSYLKKGEFPRFNEFGQMNCPPAPPHSKYEIRICQCKQVYQILPKNAPSTICGFCTLTL